MDVGNTFSVSTDELTADYIAEVTCLMGYDALNLGNRDFVFGQAFLKRLEARYQLPLISSNIRYKKTGELFVRPYVITRFPRKSFFGIPYDWLKVGIFGLAGMAPHRPSNLSEPELELIDPLVASRTAVDALRAGCDLVILLAHMSAEECQKIVDEVEGIDVVIANDRRGSNITVGETLILPTEFGGKYIGEAVFHFDEGKEISSHDWALAVLDKKIEEDPAVADLIAEYTEVKKSLKPPIDQKTRSRSPRRPR